MLKTVQEVLPTAVEEQQGVVTVYAVYSNGNGRRIMLVEPHGKSWICSVDHGYGHAETLREAVTQALLRRQGTVAMLRAIEDRVYRDIESQL
jgi:hypothetical protein